MQGRREGWPSIRQQQACFRSGRPDQDPPAGSSREVRVGGGGEGAAGGGGPAEDAGGDLFEFPAGMVLEDVVGSAEAAEVAAAGQSAVVERDGVVQVAAPGGLPAAGEAAGQVP